MRRLALIAGTVLVFAIVFAIGALAGRWYEEHRPLPPPPAPFMGEFGGHRLREGWMPPGHFSRADFNAELEKLSPQFEDYRRHMDAIDDTFEKKLNVLLTPQQRVWNAERIKRHAQSRAANESRPHDEQLAHLAQMQNVALFRIVMLQIGYDSLNKDLKFDPSQKDAVLGLLKDRREQYLAFIDANPPPSLHLLHLASFAQRLSSPPPPPSGGQPSSQP